MNWPWLRRTKTVLAPADEMPVFRIVSNGTEYKVQVRNRAGEWRDCADEFGNPYFILRSDADAFKSKCELRARRKLLPWVEVQS